MAGSKTYTLLIFLSGILNLPGYTQQPSIPERFRQIDSKAQVIVCRNDLEINNQGGHLQGVQLFTRDDAEYAILSGSSGTEAYYAVAKLDGPAEVLSLNLLMHKPFKHAGGIQIYQDFLIVGIEDNTSKDKSKVCLYQVKDPRKPPVEPLTQTGRSGKPLRSTAGCAGMAGIGDRYLAVVGDWDTKHLDFYLIDENRIEKGVDAFENVYSIDTEKVDRTGWVDNEWLAYQNINLFRDTDGQLYLVGLGQNEEQENRADLYLVEHNNLTEFTLKKLLSRSFDCSEGSSFRSGAGINQKADGTLTLISCGSHIRDSLVLNIFQ